MQNLYQRLRESKFLTSLATIYYDFGFYICANNVHNHFSNYSMNNDEFSLVGGLFNGGLAFLFLNENLRLFDIKINGEHKENIENIIKE